MREDDRLIEELLDEADTGATTFRLQTLLDDDPELGRAVQERFLQHRHLEALLRPPGSVAQAVRQQLAHRRASFAQRVGQRLRDRQRQQWRWRGAVLLAALGLITAGLFLWTPRWTPVAATGTTEQAGAESGPRTDAGLVWGRLVDRIVTGEEAGIGPMPGAGLHPGDHLQTDAETRLIFADGRHGLYELAAASTFILPTADSPARLLAGRLRVSVLAPRPDDPLLIETPHARIQVRGTRFRLQVDADVSELQVDEGMVAFANHAGTDQAHVRAGEHYRIGNAPTPAPAPPAGLLLRWSFEESSGIEVHDQSGHERRGRLVSQVERSTQGRYGSCVRVRGAGVVIADSDAQICCPRGSVSLWIRPSMPFAAMCKLKPKIPIEFFAKNDHGGRGGYELVHGAYAEPGSFGLRISRPLAESRMATSILPQELRWYHLAATWGDGRIRLYRDGILVADVDDPQGPAPASEQLIRVGNYFHGLIDEVLLFDRSLSAEEVAGLAR